MEKLAIIVIGSHFFKVIEIESNFRAVVVAFCKRYIQYGYRQENRRNIYGPIKVFAASSANRTEYRFHINQLKDFNEFLKYHGIEEHRLTIIKKDYIELPSVEHFINEKWKDRDLQVPVIEYATSVKPTPRKFISLQPGKGKSYISMRCMQILKYRTAVIVKPMYIEKWVEDMARTFDLQKGDVVTVQGLKQLMSLLQLAKDGELNAKIIVISNKTMQLWISNYELLGDKLLEQGYACHPEDLMEVLQAGIRVIDEVHQDFHFNFKLDLYTHVERSISLSGSLKADDPFIARMQQLAYPPEERMEEQAFDKYVDIRPILYSFKEPGKIRWKNHVTKTYSHSLFEQSVIRNPNVLIKYLQLINDTIGEFYIKHNKPKEKCIVFAASIEMCTIITKYIKRLYPTLVVGRYVEEDDFSVIAASDIIISTIQSAGTALDIPDLITVIMTTNISSTQSNIQTMGRLRYIPDRPLYFCYFICEDISKHLEYHSKKIELLAEKSISYRIFKFGYLV